MRKKDSGIPAVGKIPDFGSLPRHPVVLTNKFGGVPDVREPRRAAHMRALMPAPQPHPPARNVQSLVDRLRKEDNGKYLYRGQIRHFPALIPSVYRRAMMAETAADPVIAIDRPGFEASLSRRDLVRMHVLNDMMRDYGPSVGNILAQQYGLNSEALDVTTSIDVAAFFATRTYPAYDHFPGSDAAGDGVIYRFPLFESLANLETLDVLFTFGLKNIDPFGDVAFVAFRKRRDLKPESVQAIEMVFEKHGGSLPAEVRTRPLVVENTLYAREIRELWAARLHRSVPSLENTRLGRQMGGSIRTISRWLTTIPAWLDVMNVPGLGNVFDPPFAIGESLMGIDNVNRYPKLDIFLFRHSAAEVSGLSPEYLWPTPTEDWLYKELMDAVTASRAEYLERGKIPANDFARGILDPGYDR
jgi:hypothetical protein